jgi:hypothetical protein
VKGTTQFGEEVGAAVEQGKLVPLSQIFYNPESDCLEYHFFTNIPKEEILALLRKYRCYPNA